MLSPEFFTDEKVVLVSFPARLLFAGMWCCADREGRLGDSPVRLKMQIFPSDQVDIDPLLEELITAGLIHRYVVDGQRVLGIPGFLKHQNPHHREKPSVLPPRPSLGTARAQPRHGLGPTQARPEPHLGTAQPGGEDPGRISNSEDPVTDPVVGGEDPVRKQPPPPDSGLGFFHRFQQERVDAGFVAEKPPVKAYDTWLVELDAWWAETLDKLDGDQGRLWDGVKRYAKNDYWKNRDPPWPFAGFRTQWPDFVPKKRKAS